MVAISHARGKNDMTQNEKCDNISYVLSLNNIESSIFHHKPNDKQILFNE